MDRRTKQGGNIMNYVVHYCKNRNCNNVWIDKDITNAKTRPPKWKFCKNCCEKMGIDFDTQVTPKRKLQNSLQGGVNTPKIDDKTNLDTIGHKIIINLILAINLVKIQLFNQRKF